MRDWLFVALMVVLVIVVAVAYTSLLVSAVHKATPAVMTRYCAVYDDTVVDYGNCVTIGWGTR